MNLTTRRIARAAIVAALYVALTFVVFPIASGAIQFRPSEALTLLPLFMPESILGLWIGCMLANLVTGCTVIDIFLGSAITLVAATMTYFTGRLIKQKPFVETEDDEHALALDKYQARENVLRVIRIIVGGLWPILGNAFFLPLIWMWAYGELEFAYWVQFGFLVATEALAIYTLGTLFCLALYRIQFKRPDFIK